MYRPPLEMELLSQHVRVSYSVNLVYVDVQLGLIPPLMLSSHRSSGGVRVVGKIYPRALQK